MWSFVVRLRRSTVLSRGRAATLSVGVLFLTAHPASAQPGNLNFFKSWTLTGDYLVAGAVVKDNPLATLADGLATVNITVAAPPNGPSEPDIMGAFLVWQTVFGQNDSNIPVGAKFNNHDLAWPDPNNPSVYQTLAYVVNPSGTAPCWSQGGGTGAPDAARKSKTLRADVLRFLPIVNGKRQAIGQTIPVTVPHSGNGNVTPSTAGLSLIVIYRDRSVTAKLRSIVMYNGGWTMDQSTEMMTQTVQGFYQGSTETASSKMTHIVAGGSPNKPDRLLFRADNEPDSVIAVNAFQAAWENYTFPASQYTTLGASKVTTTVDHNGEPTFDCLSWGVVLYAIDVQDSDGDGIVDRLESPMPQPPITNPDGQPVPDLFAMGANPYVKDIVIEFGYMTAAAGTTYGYPPDAPERALEPSIPEQVIDSMGHSHLPPYASLKMVGDAFKAAPVANPYNACLTWTSQMQLPASLCLQNGIRVHFDVGNQPEAAYPLTDGYVVPGSVAGGGEAINEIACNDATSPGCQFPLYPGTVGWKRGFRNYRDEVLAVVLGTPPAPAPPTEANCAQAEQDGLSYTTCQRRFDSNRKTTVHYALMAHSTGIPKSTDPNSPLYHVPRNTSGGGDTYPGGGDFQVTLGQWDGFTGTTLMQATTLMHELGHNLGRKHGGDLDELNCKPNYQSVMNYLFQVSGLVTPLGPVAGYSSQTLPALDPANLSESAGIPNMFYSTTRWYAPLASIPSYVTFGTTAATHHCDGSIAAPEETPMVRVDNETFTSVSPAIDWNANGVVGGTFAQNISFSANASKLLNGSNDWEHVDLRQVGARRNVGILVDGLFEEMSLDLGSADTGPFDPGFFEPGFFEPGFFEPGFFEPGFFEPGFFEPGAPREELTFDTAKHLANTPRSLTAQVTGKWITTSWNGPLINAARVLKYHVFRATATTVTSSTVFQEVGTLLRAQGAPPPTTFVDKNVKNNTTYIYAVTAEYDDTTPHTVSGPSNFVVIFNK